MEESNQYLMSLIKKEDNLDPNAKYISITFSASNDDEALHIAEAYVDGLVAEGWLISNVKLHVTIFNLVVMNEYEGIDYH